MKAIFINAKDQSIEQIELQSGNQAMYDKIGFGCTLVELVSNEFNDDGLFCDEEGVFEGHSADRGNHFGFLWCISKAKGTFQRYFLICGNAIVIGCDEEGESQDCKTPINEVKKRVLFLPSKAVQDYKLKF